MDLELADTTAVVTGASRGIGLAIVTALLDEGVRVVAASRSGSAALARTGAIGVEADLSTPQGPDLLAARALTELGEVDLLVNNVGGGEGSGLTDGFAAFDDDAWQRSFQLNFFSAVRTTRALLPSLIRRGGGIVNVSSSGARTPQAGPIVYTTAKAALTAFGKGLAEEVGPKGVRVNTVSPGPVRTAMWESPQGYGAQLAESAGLAHGDLLAGLPGAMGMTTGRLIEPEEIGALVAYLASRRAGSIAGSDHLIDGGAVKTA